MATSCFARAVTYLLWYPMGPVIHIFPLALTGLSSSVTFATTFIFLNASVTKADQAMAVSSLLSLYGIGSALGTTGSKVVMTAVLRSKLAQRLSGQDLKSSEVREAKFHVAPTTLRCNSFIIPFGGADSSIDSSFAHGRSSLSA